ncbi:MAG: tetratricopeptide repeat protein [Candidatus Zhuqueibacterota bacterium]
MIKKWGRKFYRSALPIIILILGCTMNQNRVTTHSAEALTFYQQGVKDYYNNYLNRAFDHFTRAIQIDSCFAMACCRLSMTCHNLGDAPTAQRFMKRAKTYITSVTLQEKLLISICEAELSGDSKGRTVLLRQFYQKFPADMECRLLLAADCNQRHLYNQAEAYLLEIVKVDPENLPANKLLADTYSKFNQFDRAKKHIQVCLAAEPDDADAIVAMAKLYQQQGEYDKAQQAYYSAIEILPYFQKAHLQLGDFYLEISQFEKALQQFHLAYELLPSTVANRSIEYARIAEVYMLMGRLEKSTRSAFRSLDLDNRNIKSLAVLGKVHLLGDEIAEACGIAEKMKSIIGQSGEDASVPAAEFYDLLGEIACKKGDWDGALESFRLAWQNSPHENATEYQMKLAHTYLRVGDYRQAKHHCSQIILRNPNHALSHFILAQAYDGLKNHDASEQEFFEFISLSEATNRYANELDFAQKRILLVNRKNFAVRR